MQRTRSKPSAAATTSSTLVSGLKASPTWKPRSRARAARAGGSAARLEVEGDAVRTGGWSMPEVVLRLAPPSGGSRSRRPSRWIERRDRLEDDRADRDRLDEVAVADVEVEDARARRGAGSRPARRGGRSRPRRATARPRPCGSSVPAHARILGRRRPDEQVRRRSGTAASTTVACGHGRSDPQAGDEEARRAVPVRQSSAGTPGASGGGTPATRAPRSSDRRARRRPRPPRSRRRSACRPSRRPSRRAARARRRRAAARAGARAAAAPASAGRAARRARRGPSRARRRARGRSPSAPAAARARRRGRRVTFVAPSRRDVLLQLPRAALVQLDRDRPRRRAGSPSRPGAAQRSSTRSPGARADARGRRAASRGSAARSAPPRAPRSSTRSTR